MVKPWPTLQCARQACWDLLGPISSLNECGHLGDLEHTVYRGLKIGGHQIRSLAAQNTDSHAKPHLQGSESVAETPGWTTYRLGFFTSFRGCQGSFRPQHLPMGFFASSVRTTKSTFQHGGFYWRWWWACRWHWHFLFCTMRFPFTWMLRNGVPWCHLESEIRIQEAHRRWLVGRSSSRKGILVKGLMNCIRSWEVIRSIDGFYLRTGYVALSICDVVVF